MTVPLQAVERRRTVARPLELLDDVAMMSTPDLEWLIDGRLHARTDALLAGPPGIGKSLLALDLGLSIAAGQRWCGADVRVHGPVVYLALDGAVGLKARIAAWKAAHGFALTMPLGLHVWNGAINFSRRLDVERLIATVKTQKPVLTIIDTLARVMGSLDENVARDVGIVVDAIGELRAASGGSVLLIHHTGLSRSDRERGSSALRAAVDTAMLLRQRGRYVRLECAKQRDAEPFAPVDLERVGPTIHAVSIPAIEHVKTTVAELDVIIVSYLREHSGVTTNALVKALGHRREDVWACLEQLRETGRLRAVPGPRNSNVWSIGDL